MKKIKLEFQEKADGVDFLIKNFTDLDGETTKKLEEFSLKRNGYFRHDLEQFGIRRKLNETQISQIFKLLKIDAEFVDSSVVVEEIPIETELVDFGKYKGYKWCNVPLNYLKWIYSQNENRFASKEIKRREYAPLDIKHRTIEIGKYKGSKWVDVPIDYLEWILSKFEEKHENYKFAEAVLNQKKNSHD